MFSKAKPDSTTFKRTDVRRVFRRHRGAQAELARRLELKPVTICLWLKGKVQSARIDAAAAQYAAELVEVERERGAAA